MIVNLEVTQITILLYIFSLTVVYVFSSPPALNHAHHKTNKQDGFSSGQCGKNGTQPCQGQKLGSAFLDLS